MMSKKVKLLDCTLRDGGYYNNWNFDLKNVKKYLKQIYLSNIDVVELGFNFFQKNSNYGKFAFVDSNVIKKIPKNKNTKIALMINGSDFFKIQGNYKKYLDKIFKKKKNIDIIRIAAHYKDYKKLIKYIKYLKLLNYKIFFNLMQVNNVSQKNLKQCLNLLDKSKSVDVFYFADSFGNLKPSDIKKLCSIIKKNWKKEIGIHSHDNCGLALSNSIQAFKSGATWIDGTIQGMGRGAGNVSTENLLKFFKNYNYKPESINKISKNYFKDLKQKYKWGESKYYRIAAKFNIHPTYIQMLQTDGRYSDKEIKKSINSLKKIVATSYDPRLLEQTFNNVKNIEGRWNAEQSFNKKRVLILGQGKSLRDKSNINKIQNYILKTNCVVISININNLISERLIDFYASCNETRISVDNQKYDFLKKPLIIPEQKLKQIKKNYKKINYLDYGMMVKNNQFYHNSKYSIIPYNLTFAYAIGVVLAGNAKDILIAGFDGYKNNQKEQIEMQKTLDLIKKNYRSLRLKTLTKTSYNLI
jgi:4-hydroxy 2-oxovalerate aldolase